MNLEYIKVELFETSYKRKLTYDIPIFWDSPEYIYIYIYIYKQLKVAFKSINDWHWTYKLKSSTDVAENPYPVITNDWKGHTNAFV